MINYLKFILCFLLFMAISCSENKQYVQPSSFGFNLYPDDIPCDSKKMKDEYQDGYKGHLIDFVRNPEIRVFLPRRLQETKLPFFVIIPANDGKSINYGTHGKALYDKLIKLDIGVALYTYRMRHMKPKTCTENIFQYDFSQLEEVLSSYFVKWGIDSDQLGIISFDNNFYDVYTNINKNNKKLKFKYQIYLEPNLSNFQLSDVNKSMSELNLLFTTNISTDSEIDPKLLAIHEKLQSLNCRSALLQINNYSSWGKPNFQPYEEKVFPWIIRKLSFEKFGKKYVE